MYITYYRNQHSVDFEDRTDYRLNVTGGDYRPTLLIRVSDWKKVPGEEAVDGYHALSYCREQSGKVIKRKDDSGEYDCIDNGRHCIVDDVENPKSRNFFRTTIKTYVQYEELLQQICNDFQIEYLWYDKVCIDSSNMETRLKEIKQMHKIYGNARYTLAMVPEVHYLRNMKSSGLKLHRYRTYFRYFTDADINRSCWMKRSWPLGELMMSKHLLIIGTDAHTFQHSLHVTDAPSTLENYTHELLDFKGKEPNSINQVLKHAHFRTGTKPHDMIFTLTNIFTHILDNTDINYETHIQLSFNKFYRRISSKDLSILCFGSNRKPNGVIIKNNTMTSYNLPSWTGIAGCHLPYCISSMIHPSSTYNIDPDTMCMHYTTEYYWNLSISQYDNGCFTSSLINKYIKNSYTYNEEHINYARYKKRQWTDITTASKDDILNEWAVNLRNASTLFMTHYHQHPGDVLSRLRPLSLSEDCKECIVLPILLKSFTPAYTNPRSDAFNLITEGTKHNYFLPVFRKSLNNTERYEAIGVYYVGNDKENSMSPTFNWNHCVGKDDIYPEMDPGEILDILFEHSCHGNIPKEFIIE